MPAVRAGWRIPMLREASLDHTPLLPARRRTVRTRAIGAGSMGENTRSAAAAGAAGAFVSPGMAPDRAGPAMGGLHLGSAALPAFPSRTGWASAHPGVTGDPDVFLIALPLA